MKSTYFRILILSAVINLACTTKVSEWVLLNAPPEQYTLVYFHNSPLTETVIKQNALVDRNIMNANIHFRIIQKHSIERPYYALYHGKTLFAKFNDYKEIKGLTTSPIREKIASEIMDGKLCVFLFLETGDKLKDDKDLKVIQKALENSPFKEVITVVRLDRNNREESHFVSLLLNVEDDLRMIPGPMLFGVFGKFRVLEPLLGRGISEENIKLMIDFLTADCSCLIKDDLPGIDIIFPDKWDNPATALVNKILDENPSLLHH